MERNELNIKLKEVLDMTVFSQILEMDEEEARESSSTALYGFLERGKEKVDFMEIAL
jgi:osomolarity two-component system phosphorelay intermediate protein YPD1